MLHISICWINEYVGLKTDYTPQWLLYQIVHVHSTIVTVLNIVLHIVHVYSTVVTVSDSTRTLYNSYCIEYSICSTVSHIVHVHVYSTVVTVSHSIRILYSSYCITNSTCILYSSGRSFVCIQYI